eukprot:6176189-Pleurochrysis_carterae.AAC.3
MVPRKEKQKLSFDLCKRNAMGKLDKSPKGSLDKPIAELVHAINAHDDYVTTSSCSGRIVLVRSGSSRRKAPTVGCWLLVSHAHVTVDRVQQSLAAWSAESAPDGASNSQLVSGLADSHKSHDTDDQGNMSELIVFKHEPAILHVQCRDIPSAQRLLQAATQPQIRNFPLCSYHSPHSALPDSCSSCCSLINLHHFGLLQAALRAHFRESGLVLSSSSKVMLAIRTTANCLELPIGRDGCCLLPAASLEFLVEHANGKYDLNMQRLAALADAFKAECCIGESGNGGDPSECTECDVTAVNIALSG